MNPTFPRHHRKTSRPRGKPRKPPRPPSPRPPRTASRFFRFFSSLFFFRFPSNVNNFQAEFPFITVPRSEKKEGKHEKETPSVLVKEKTTASVLSLSPSPSSLILLFSFSTSTLAPPSRAQSPQEPSPPRRSASRQKCTPPWGRSRDRTPASSLSPSTRPRTASQSSKGRCG